MFDVFYFFQPTGIFPHERPIKSLNQAYQQSRTRFFWIVNYLVDYENFDFDWRPDKWQQQQKHVWASVHQRDCGTWLVPKSGYLDTNYHDEVKLKTRMNLDLWQRPIGLNLDEFDFTWHPDYSDPPFIYQFGTQWQKTGGPRYLGHQSTDQIKFLDQPRAQKISQDPHWHIPEGLDIEQFDFTWHPDATDPPLIYQFGTQWQKTGGPQYHVPGAKDICYVSSPRAQKISQDPQWRIPDHIEITAFDFSWHPDSTEQPYIYQFGTQWQKTGGPQYHVPGAVDIKFLDQILFHSKTITDKIVMIDHFNEQNHWVYTQLKDQWPDITRVRYVDNYLDTLKRIAQQHRSTDAFVWVVSSICDYSNFDFTWHPESWQAAQLHVFASGQQKFGDTFFMNTQSFVSKLSTSRDLRDFDCNFVCDLSVPRLPWPTIQHHEDTQVLPVVISNFTGPAAVFSDQNYVDTVPDMSLWQENFKTIMPLTNSGSTVLVPKTAIPYIKTQLYDYPYIDQQHQKTLDQPLDVIYISNGEPRAEENYQWLKTVLQDKGNRLKRIQNVKGRVAAYHAALEISETAWAFCVFAKLQVNPNFNWSWQPDRLRLPKHYIFHAQNPITGLEYGHQALIAYNRTMTLKNNGAGLDFTLDQSHDIVPELSGLADFVHDKWTVWRTAFREVLKLRFNDDAESQSRLSAWCNIDLINNEISGYARLGSQDALAYYHAVNGDFQKLKLSYEWHWLANYVCDIGRLTHSDIYL